MENYIMYAVSKLHLVGGFLLGIGTVCLIANFVEGYNAFGRQREEAIKAFWRAFWLIIASLIMIYVFPSEKKLNKIVHQADVVTIQAVNE